MRTAYLECQMGISGDMTLGALIDAGVDADEIRAGIDSLKLEGVELHVEKVIKGGFAATAVTVKHPEQHAHRHLSDIHEILNRSEVITPSQKELALKIFEAIATAEACVHGSSINKVHFHEVGAIDSIVDIIGAAIGFDLLNVDQVHCSPIPTGYGLINIDHGICPVPAPGTAEILKGIPLQDVPVEAELTTPTGAAIVKVLVDRFGHRPPMTIEQIGYGSGTKTFPQRANLLRLFVGESIETPNQETVALLETNLDDTTAETIGYTRELLEKAGALDVYSTSIQMKKNRPGTLLSVLCKPSQSDKMKAILFEQTGTLGIRITQLERSTLAREVTTVETVYGPIRGKLTNPVGRTAWFQPEFEDCAQAAAKHEVPLREVYRTAQGNFVELTSQLTTHKTDIHHHDHDHDHD
ncbi:MAG TPA: nickel pincer cofactor biosynthesis protein LarC, partial [Planctomycetaceae bacterium]|nr:nickel pincer cofactor biosynthesis protein LarC [Planctomycetaceae bacterium]